MTTLAELIKQKEALDAQIAIARQTELADAISKVKALIAEYGLTQKDVFGGGVKRGPKTTSTTKATPKFRDPATGATWAGRGNAPKWIKDKDRAQFAI
jgi:DNA-binding protein H-NS